jgi:hypothetical protein
MAKKRMPTVTEDIGEAHDYSEPQVMSNKSPPAVKPTVTTVDRGGIEDSNGRWSKYQRPSSATDLEVDETEGSI